MKKPTIALTMLLALTSGYSHATEVAAPPVPTYLNTVEKYRYCEATSKLAAMTMIGYQNRLSLTEMLEALRTVDNMLKVDKLDAWVENIAVEVYSGKHGNRMNLQSNRDMYINKLQDKALTACMRSL